MTVKKSKNHNESDYTYFLKLVMYTIVGSQWLFLVDPGLTKQIPLPIGVILGITFARHEHFQLDRKVEYAVLITACFVGFWSHVGVYINIL